MLISDLLSHTQHTDTTDKQSDRCAITCATLSLHLAVTMVQQSFAMEWFTSESVEWGGGFFSDCISCSMLLLNLIFGRGEGRGERGGEFAHPSWWESERQVVWLIEAFFLSFPMSLEPPNVP